jgi:two-component system NtrC family response regulator
VIERLGGRGEIAVDVRVICATHQDLENLIKEGSFREDLFYRISEITLRIPPLRDRQGDAVVLAKTFLDLYAKQNGRALRGFREDALSAIEAYGWPGNVRELENRIKRGVIMAESSQIGADDLELTAPTEPQIPFNLRQVRERAERQALTQAVGLVNGNLSRAAEVLGVARPTLYALLDKYNMRP